MKRVFKDLAKDSVEFMSAGRNWRFPRTPTYPYYELMNPPYNSTAPFWRERREEIFAFLRNITGKEYVHYLSYSEANDASFAIPMSIASNGPYGFGFIDPGKSFITIVKNDYHKALRTLSIYDPILYKWNDRKTKYLAPEKKFYVFEKPELATLVLAPGTKFFYFEMGAEDVKN